MRTDSVPEYRQRGTCAMHLATRGDRRWCLGLHGESVKEGSPLAPSPCGANPANSCLIPYTCVQVRLSVSAPGYAVLFGA
jgi:hypothetical protein